MSMSYENFMIISFLGGIMAILTHEWWFPPLFIIVLSAIYIFCDWLAWRWRAKKEKQ